MRSPETVNREPSFLLWVAGVPRELPKEESGNLPLVLGTAKGRSPFAEVPSVPEEAAAYATEKSIEVFSERVHTYPTLSKKKKIKKDVKNRHNLLKINNKHIWMNCHMFDEIG